ncbi:Ger(x)C family spore germination protein [Paenibacillus flagellatus]|nr:Ger(x)C family spore germination protein [Paenibacillus flagellatus]
MTEAVPRIGRSAPATTGTGGNGIRGANRRRVALLSAALLLPLLLGGCWDRTEVNDIAIVMATGVDKEKDGYRISVIIPLPGNMGGASGGGGGSGGQAPYTIDSEKGRTLREANARLQSRLSRRLFYAHRKVLLIGEELAKEGLVEVMDITARVAENRLTSYMAVTKGKAYDVLNASPKLERFSSEAMRELLKSDNTIQVQVKDVVIRMSGEGQDAILPYVEVIRSEGTKKPSEELQISGFAYTRNGKMVGVAKGDEANGMRWLTESFNPYVETVEMKNGLVSLIVRRGESAIRPSVVGGKIRYRIRAEGEATILEAQDGNEYEHERNIERLEEQLEKKIREDMAAAMRVVKTDRSDFPGFGVVLKRTFPGRWRDEWRREWETAIRDVEPEYEVNMVVNRTGMFSKNVGLKERDHE